jgi:hypothetical protein
MLTARAQQARPGEIGVNHVFIDNRYPEQAVPVVVQRTPEPLRVQVAGSVTIDPKSVVPVRAVRQQWEYRTITATGGQDPAGIIAGAGSEGWEAVGYQSGPGGLSVLLKRPR